jgi:putative protease
MHSAVENGADAIYFGLERWNARERANNFQLAELPAIMADLHRRGVKGYVTFNTLIYESELAPAEEMLRGIARAGADAIIVQDLGVARLSRAVAPGLPVHASTQMTITDAASAEVARALGVERAILARELSTGEIAKIARGTKLELEVFVHGALCVSYSGQCFTSASWGGRSANRGECAQACRLPYDLVVDDEVRDLGPVKYLLSPLDLAGYEAIPALVAAGVVSFKIEGRLKSPEYVAATTAIYRKALDRALAGATSKEVTTPDERRDLEQVYSRGGSAGFLAGTDHQAILEGTFPAHRGLKLGTVLTVDLRRNAVLIAHEETPRAGDGILFTAPGLDPQAEDRPAGRVSEVIPQMVGKSFLVFERQSVAVERVPAGATAWRNADPELTARLRTTFEGETPRRRAALSMKVRGKVGASLVVEATDDLGNSVSTTTAERLERADRSPIDQALAEDKLGRLGASPFELQGLSLELEGPCRIPVSVLNRVRRELVEKLEAVRSRAPERVLAPGVVHGGMVAEPVSARDQGLAVVPLCRTEAHLEGAIAAGSREVMLDFMEFVGLGKAVGRARTAGVAVVIAPPRIQKPGEERFLEGILALEPEGVLVRSLGQLEQLSRMTERPRLIGDFSLNAANAIAARVLLEKGLETIVPAYDLSVKELDLLLEHVPVSRVELVVHQHLPMFHTEYCAYARLLSPEMGFKGTSYLDCGRPCEKHKVSLKDSRTGAAHPVVVDVGCRNTVFSAEANSVADDVPRFVARGVKRFRVELLGENAAQAETLIRGYVEVAAGKANGGTVRTKAGAVRRLGVLRVEA